MSSYSRQQLEAWLKTISVTGGRVLDIGGSQKPLGGRLKDFTFNEYRILDLENPHEKKQEPDYVGDMSYFIQGTGNFDYVFCIEVMEYVFNPVQALMNINRFLKKNGTLFISFHFLYPIHNPMRMDYLRYTPEGSKRLLQEAGFQIINETMRIEKKGVILKWYESEKMKPASGIEHNIIGNMIMAKKI